MSLIISLEEMHPECQAREIRKQRAPLLVNADIAINKAIDNGEDATPLRVYRQALRDITTTFANDLANVAWPVKPL
jgi:hypothetical protein